VILEKTRRAIEDCRLALNWFDRKPTGEDFRLTLFLCLTLLRAIGHIIQAEVKDDSNLNELSKKQFQLFKEEDLYKEFIVSFRNKVVKEYRSSVAWASITEQESKAHRMEYLITEGLYKDSDVRDMIEESIKWWESYVDKLEQEYQRSPLK
jgi:hypothetical protein